MYKLETELGSGTYGEVRKATRVGTREVYACKTVDATGKRVLVARRVSSSVL